MRFGSSQIISNDWTVYIVFDFRFLSTLNSKSVPMAASGLSTSKEQVREFLAVFPDIVRDLTDGNKHTDVPEAPKWLAKVMAEYSRHATINDMRYIVVVLQ